MADIAIRIEGRAGRITLTRPAALNALTPEMGAAIEAAIDGWATDDRVALVIIDAEGERAFCSGGDIAMIYQAGRAGDFSVARQFWREEYRLNAKLFHYPKPVVTFMQGFTMGGGVGIGCHASHRVVDESSQIAMPECGIGLVPDVGGTLMLARAPGHTGEYLGTTGTRMGPGDAIYAGFADYFVPHIDWPGLIADLAATGDIGLVEASADTPPPGELALHRDEIDRAFAATTLAEIVASLQAAGGRFAETALKPLTRVSPLSASITLDLVRRVRAEDTIEDALGLEFRATYRCIEDGDFLEGIRAQVIDKDRSPRWKHGSAAEVTANEVAAMLAPLGENALKLEG